MREKLNLMHNTVQVYFNKEGERTVHEKKKDYIGMKKEENVASFTLLYWTSFQKTVKKSIHTLTGQKPGQKGDVCDLRVELLSSITLIICD